MAIIAGTTIRWPLSPRLVEIPSTETSLSTTDAQDTLLDLEDDEEGIVWPHTREMSGGQDLGSGTSVGFTIEYQDTKIVPQRTSSRTSGTATTGSATQLIDSAADFVTDGVVSGDWIINFTDQSVTEVLEVIDLNTLNVRDLTDGTDNDFDIGDAYKIWEVSDFTLDGGNHVAVDTLAAAINPMFPTFGRFCTRTSSSSATALSQQSLEQALFFEGVVIDTVNGTAGTGDVDGVPIGTRAVPSSNAVDAKTIADARNVNKFVLASSVSLTTGDYSSGYTWIADKRIDSLVPLTGVDLENNVFLNLTFAGDADGNNRFEDCEILANASMYGYIIRCGFAFNFNITGTTRIIDCYSLIGGSSYPILNIGNNQIIVRNFNGSLGIEGMTGSPKVREHSVEVGGGRVFIESGCTGSNLSIRGTPYEIVNNSLLEFGTNLFDQTESEKVNDLHRFRGLDSDNPLTVTPTSSTTAGKTLEHTGDPATSITTTRTA